MYFVKLLSCFSLLQWLHSQKWAMTYLFRTDKLFFSVGIVSHKTDLLPWCRLRINDDLKGNTKRLISLLWETTEL